MADPRGSSGCAVQSNNHNTCCGRRATLLQRSQLDLCPICWCLLCCLGASVGLPRDAVQEAARYTFDARHFNLETWNTSLLYLLDKITTFSVYIFLYIQVFSGRVIFLIKMVNFPLLSIHCKYFLLVNTTYQDTLFLVFNIKYFVYNLKYGLTKFLAAFARLSVLYTPVNVCTVQFRVQ
jgi:hypothetical protein